MRPELVLHYVHSESMGYGRLGTSLYRALVDLGVDVYDSQPMPEEARRPHEEAVHTAAKRTNVVAWASVPAHARGWWSGQHTVIFTMWEATRLPETFRQHLHEFDQVLVPSRHNQELFSRYHDRVSFVPLGIDPTRWSFVPRTPPADEFRFLVAGSGPRKGTDLAYRAFVEVFGKDGSWGSGPVPYLVMKNPRREDFRHPRVHVIGGRIDATAEIDLYASAHCYLQPSRGEGFGLQPLQAIAQGCPTILTAAHGHDAFAHLGFGLSSTPAKSAYFFYGDAGEWWEPDFDELCEMMRRVYEHYDDAISFASASAQVAAEEFTWRRCAQRFIDAVGPERLEVPYQGNGTWFTPERRRYLVVTNRPWRCDIAGTSYWFERGQEYWEMADVKRILFEAGVLDPACLTEDVDLGLTPEQAARLDDYTAAHSHCPTCHQRLGSQPTRAEEIYAEGSH